MMLKNLIICVVFCAIINNSLSDEFTDDEDLENYFSDDDYEEYNDGEPTESKELRIKKRGIFGNLGGGINTPLGGLNAGLGGGLTGSGGQASAGAGLGINTPLGGFNAGLGGGLTGSGSQAAAGSNSLLGAGLGAGLNTPLGGLNAGLGAGLTGSGSQASAGSNAGIAAGLGGGINTPLGGLNAGLGAGLTGSGSQAAAGSNSLLGANLGAGLNTPLGGLNAGLGAGLTGSGSQAAAGSNSLLGAGLGAGLNTPLGGLNAGLGAGLTGSGSQASAGSNAGITAGLGGGINTPLGGLNAGLGAGLTGSGSQAAAGSNSLLGANLGAGLNTPLGGLDAGLGAGLTGSGSQAAAGSNSLLGAGLGAGLNTPLGGLGLGGSLTGSSGQASAGSNSLLGGNLGAGLNTPLGGLNAGLGAGLTGSGSQAAAGSNSLLGAGLGAGLNTPLGGLDLGLGGSLTGSSGQASAGSNSLLGAGLGTGLNTPLGGFNGQLGAGLTGTGSQASAGSNSGIGAGLGGGLNTPLGGLNLGLGGSLTGSSGQASAGSSSLIGAGLGGGVNTPLGGLDLGLGAGLTGSGSQAAAGSNSLLGAGLGAGLNTPLGGLNLGLGGSLTGSSGQASAGSNSLIGAGLGGGIKTPVGGLNAGLGAGLTGSGSQAAAGSNSLLGAGLGAGLNTPLGGLDLGLGGSLTGSSGQASAGSNSLLGAGLGAGLNTPLGGLNGQLGAGLTGTGSQASAGSNSGIGTGLGGGLKTPLGGLNLGLGGSLTGSSGQASAGSSSLIGAGLGGGVKTPLGGLDLGVGAALTGSGSQATAGSNSLLGAGLGAGLNTPLGGLDLGLGGSLTGSSGQASAGSNSLLGAGLGVGLNTPLGGLNGQLGAGLTGSGSQATAGSNSLLGAGLGAGLNAPLGGLDLGLGGSLTGSSGQASAGSNSLLGAGLGGGIKTPVGGLNAGLGAGLNTPLGGLDLGLGGSLTGSSGQASAGSNSLIGGGLSGGIKTPLGGLDLGLGAGLTGSGSQATAGSNSLLGAGLGAGLNTPLGGLDLGLGGSLTGSSGQASAGSNSLIGAGLGGGINTPLGGLNAELGAGLTGSGSHATAGSNSLLGAGLGAGLNTPLGGLDLGLGGSLTGSSGQASAGSNSIIGGGLGGGINTPLGGLDLGLGGSLTGSSGQASAGSNSLIGAGLGGGINTPLGGLNAELGAGLTGSSGQTLDGSSSGRLNTSSGGLNAELSPSQQLLELNDQSEGGVKTPPAPEKLVEATGKRCKRKPVTVNAKLSCTATMCKATCISNFQFPNGELTIYINCVDGDWEVKNNAYGDEIPSCEPICLPQCQNKGICIEPGKCQCPENFVGPQCQYENKQCLQKPALPKNSISSCTATTCTFQCQSGYRFPDGNAIMNMVCKNGDWAPSRADLVSIPDCQPTCTPECLNGGNCLAYNLCNCPDEFRGPQCQYSIDVCSPKRLIFNGAYHCESNSDTMQCNINCPQGIQFEYPPAEKYICEYSTGVYLPSNIPQCVLNSNVSNSHNIMSEPSKPEVHIGVPHYNFDDSTDFSQVQLPGLYSIYSNKGDDIINKIPKPAMCTVWNGNTVKTFDGLVYNIPIHCSHTLMQDEIDGTFSIILRTCASVSTQPCPYSLDIFIQNLQYSFEDVEGQIKLFTPQKELPIPSQLYGLRVTMVGTSLKITLETIQATVIWDTKKMISIEATPSLWNRTSGLCGTLDKNIENDMTSKQGVVLKVRKTFIDSWRAPNMDTDEKCAMERNQDMPEKQCDAKTKLAAANICKKLINSAKFADCLPLLNKNSLLAACMSDYCNCDDQEHPDKCVCDTISVIVKDCQFQGVRLENGWRDLDICPLKCTDGRIYKSCGPSFEPCCGSAIEAESTMCHEGCFCPEGTLQSEGKCVQPEACPCKLRGKVFTPGSKITRDCNTCSCEGGLWKCTDATCGSRCAAVGDPHYVTFDGKRYDFVGKCSYYLLKTDNYSIEAENVACPGSMSDLIGVLPTGLSESSSCTKSITVNIAHGVNGKSQQIRLKQGRQILVDGLEVNKLPKSLQQGTIKLRQASSLITLIEFQDGIKVWWDGISRVYIDAPASYRGKTKGLCGTFNNNLQDDFLTPEGDIEATVGPFGDKWRTKESCQYVADLPHIPHPCQLNIENKAKAEKLCSKLVSHIFDECHWSVDPTPFYEDCLYDVCACKGELGSCSCPIFSAYAAECARQNIIINWRYAIHDCAVKCPLGQVYEECGDACSRTCEDLQSEVPCKTSCVEGCRCPPGQVLDDRHECVPIAACSCAFKGLIFNPGYKEVRPGKQYLELCTCMGAGWVCREALNDDSQKYPPAADIRHRCMELQNEEFTTCEPEDVLTCKNMHLPFEDTTPADCHPGCVCKKGYVFDVSQKKCVLPKDCSCHHGGRSYNDGDKIFEECNTCTCNGGSWNCTTNPCASTCSAWGDSHFETFDGKDYDFQGVCDYVLSKGVLQGGEGFSVTLQNVLCGSLGVTCSKSVTIALLGANGESITLDADSPIPGIKKYDEPTKALKTVTKPSKLSIHRAGIFIIVEAPGYGLQVKWDRGTRVYIKLQNKWKGRVVGLCGNYNGDANDDLKTPSGGIETSPLIFGHSWKLQDFCSVPTEPIDACESHPLRKTWAQRKCGVLKSDVFKACHSEVPVEKYLKRCIFDTCACDQGGDCECLCTALAAYAHACTMRGVPIKWRTQELCPMQCDPLCSSYSSCVPACPIETCDDMLDQAKSQRMCHEDICVEGCNIKPCPAGFKYLNDTYKECVPQALCKPVCLELNGVVYYEGDVIKTDECQTCRCSRGKEKCIGEPCKPSTPPTVVPPQGTQEVQCTSGWSSWFNQDKAEAGPVKTPSKGLKDGDLEPVPSYLLMKNTNGYAHCPEDNITAIECRTVGTHHSPKSTGEDVECSLEKGLLCAGRCHDFEVRVLCVCEEEEELTTIQSTTGIPVTFETTTLAVTSRTLKAGRTTPTRPPSTTVAPTTIVTVSLCNAFISSIEHPTDCDKFLECAPTGGYTVLKSCDQGLMYNPVTRICDWPSSVIAIKPKCEVTTESPKTTLTEGTTPTTKKTVPTTPRCEEGFIWDDCALPCGKSCDYYGKSLIKSGQCPATGADDCLEGCTDSESIIQCPPGYLYRNKLGCVQLSDCPCMSKLGHMVKPGEVYQEECETCQCIDNQYVCTASHCITTAIPGYTTSKAITIPPTVPTTTTVLTTPSTEYVSPQILISTVTPPPKCDPNNLVPLIDGQTPLSDVIFSASSDLGTGHLPKDARSQPTNNETSGGWSPKVNDATQYLQINLPDVTPIFGVTVGPNKEGDHVTSFKVVYTTDNVITDTTVFKPVVDENNQPQIFPGPIDSKSVPQTLFKSPVDAKTVRVYPLTWENNIALSVELIGCSPWKLTTVPEKVTEITTRRVIETTSPTTVLPPRECDPNNLIPLIDGEKPLSDAVFTASSDLGTGHLPEDARLQPTNNKTSGGWSPKVNDATQYLQINLPDLTPIFGVTVGPNKEGDHVTSFKVVYTTDNVITDTTIFKPVVDENNQPQIFPGPIDSKSVPQTLFKNPVDAKTVRVYPVTWEDTIALSVELIGCSPWKLTTIPEVTETTTIKLIEATIPTTTQHILLLSTVTPPTKCDPNNLVPLIDGENPLPDTIFTASSNLGPGYLPKDARLQSTNVETSGGWSPNVNDATQYLEITLPQLTPIFGIIVGPNKLGGRVTSFKVVYTTENVITEDTAFYQIVDENRKPQIFSGPIDSKSVPQTLFKIPVEAKTVRVYPITWENSIALTVELIGCSPRRLTTLPPVTSRKYTEATVPTTTEYISTTLKLSTTEKVITTEKGTTVLNITTVKIVPTLETTTTELPRPTTTERITTITVKEIIPVCVDPMGLENNNMQPNQIKVSSTKPSELQLTPFEALKLSSQEGWKPILNSPQQFVKFDFLEPRNLTGIRTMGGPEGWVTGYTVLFSHDDKTYNEILDHNKEQKVYIANYDSNSPVTNYFDLPINAQFLKIVPVNWQTTIELKVEPLGCYQAYPTQPPTTTAATTTTELPKGCGLCDGIVVSDHICRCYEPLRWDSHNCVNATECPCVDGIHTYSIGAKYETEDCQECICTVGGVPKCEPKQCAKCAPGLRTAKSDSCACLCEPCPDNTKMCVTNELCIDENLWCNGVIDCPDDELDCVVSTTPLTTTPQPETTTLRETTKKIEATTVTTTPSTTTTTTQITTVIPPIPCPEPKCPPEHQLEMMNSTALPIKSAIYEIVTELPPVKTSSYTKTSQRLEQTLLPRPEALTEDVEIFCPQFKCTPLLPPLNLKECNPICPEGYNAIVEPIKSANTLECPLFTCAPPIVDVFCNITGKTFSTFDGTEYKYQICNHVLARDLKDLEWNVTLRQNCSAGNYSCKKEVEIRDNDYGYVIVIYQDLTAEINGYRYTIDQISSAEKYKGIFCIEKIGETVLFTSTVHGFYVKFNEFGDVIVSVSSINKNHVDGLCGYYNDEMADDKRLPDGNLAANTVEFGDSWYVNGTEKEFCEPHACSRDLQLAAYHLCSAAKHDVFKQCANSINIDSYISMCTEASCSCLQEQLVDSKDTLTPEQYAERLKLSAQKCKCDALQQFSGQCLEANEQIDLSSWRAQENCDIACPPPLVYKDCFRRKCETTCKTVDTNDCPYVPGHCFPGCYCPEGTVRKGDQCVAISECRDCACDGFGKSQYLTYDRANFTFDANCTYLLSRDTLKSENYDFQVYVTLGPCAAEPNALQTTTQASKFIIPGPEGQKSPHGTCTQALRILIDSHAVEISRGNVKNVLELAVDGAKPKSLPLKEQWVQISEEQSTHLKVLLVAEQVEVTADFKDFSYSVRVPSYKYGSKMEGLCGDCNRNKTNDFTPKPTGLDKLSAQILEDPVKKFAYSWVADEPRLNLTEANCLIVEKEEVCKLPPPKDNPCLKILDEDIFGSCHSIVNPVMYVSSCQHDLCTEDKPNACEVLSAYAKDCARHGICLNWRQSTLCPFDCPSSLRYNPCGCAETCESIKGREKLLEAQAVGIKTTKSAALTDICTVDKAEGCFCPKGQVLRGDVCIPERECTPCDSEGHFPGDKWYPDICTTCECDKSAKTICSKKDCMVKDIVCDTGYEPLVTEDKAECCPKYTCVLKPTVPPPKECPIAILPKCGEGQRAKTEVDEFNCPKYVCECIPISECPAPAEFQLPLKPGMKIVSDEPGCCIVKKLVCDNTTCPPKLKGCVDEYYEVVKKEVVPQPGEELCCDEYVCEPPPHSCIIKKDDRKYLKEYNEKWQVEDNLCLVKECIMGIDGKPTVKDIVTKCDKTCEPGYEYVNEPDSCCGKCVQTKCCIEDKVYELGVQWHENNDNCTTYSCAKLNDTFVITKTAESCPDISECPEERKYVQGCCTLCKPAPPPTPVPTCIPKPLEQKTIGLIKEQNPTHGLCVNTQPTDTLRQCSGGCPSGTQYNDLTNTQDQFCKCCYPTELITVSVELTCEDGFTFSKEIESPKTCACNECERAKPAASPYVKA